MNQLTRQQRYQHAVEWPLMVVAVIFLAVYSWEVLADLQGQAQLVTETILDVTWGLFVLDYLVNLWLAEDRWRWFYRHPFALLVVILPMIRPLRVLRVLTMLHVFTRTAGLAFRGRLMIFGIGALILLVYTAALETLEVERNAAGSVITSFGNAIWWAMVTVSTVGYGDMYPVTTAGRFIAVILMCCGVCLIGIVTATLASWLIEQVAIEDRESQAATQKQVANLTAKVDQLINEQTFRVVKFRNGPYHGMTVHAPVGEFVAPGGHYEVTLDSVHWHTENDTDPKAGINPTGEVINEAAVRGKSRRRFSRR